MECCQKSEKKSQGSSRKWIYLCGAGLVAVIAAVTIFKVSPSNLLFYGVILACPLAHIFMMKGHDKHK